MEEVHSLQNNKNCKGAAGAGMDAALRNRREMSMEEVEKMGMTGHSKEQVTGHSKEQVTV